MELDKFSILNFKNIRQAEFDFSPKINCFVGQNGVGKTNILDAIYYLSFCKSAFNPVDSQNICHDADFFLLQGHYVSDDDVKEEVYCGLKNHRKVFKRNGKEYSKLSEHIGRIPLVLISPRDIELILGVSEDRRRFIDMVISQYDQNYLYEEIRYKKALKQRNALLRQEGNIDVDFFSVYEEIMADAGEKIHRTRKAFLEEFTPMLQAMYSQLADSSEQIALNYISNCNDGDFLNQLRAHRAKDAVVGFSLCGVHRDDLEMTLGGYPIRREGSQGQNKTYLTALKFAQFEFIKAHNNQKPILLLDDIFDKLDASRVGKILSLVSRNGFGQIFITDTDRNFISKMIDSTGMDARVFEISGGEVVHEI